MSKIQTVRGFINQRLSAAAEEIFELFERTIAEYEEQLRRSKENQHRLMDAAFNPEVRLYRADLERLREELMQRSSSEPPQAKEELFTGQEEEQIQGMDEDEIIKFTFNPDPEKTDQDGDQDVQQLVERSSSPDQEEDPPEPLHVKKEEEGEQLQASEEADVKFTLDPVKRNEDEEEKPEDVQQLPVNKEEQQEQDPVLDQEDKPKPLHIKEEWEPLQADLKPAVTPLPVKMDEGDDEEKPQPSRLHPNQSEEKRDTDGEDCGGSEDSSSEFDTDDSDTWEETVEPQRDKGGPVSETGGGTGEASVNDSESAKHPERKKKKKSDRSYNCKICGKTYLKRRSYRNHYTRDHLVGLKLPCSICKKILGSKSGLIRHMKDHRGERPYQCSQCEQAFKTQRALTIHVTYHTGEKPFPCPICQKGFRSKTIMAEHKKIHTKEAPTCSLCQISFPTKKKYYKHMTTHAREKPFSCSVCEKSFSSKETLTRHMTIHGRHTSYYKRKEHCSVCDKSYKPSYFKNHSCRVVENRPERIWCDACNKNFNASYHKHHKCKGKKKKTNKAAKEGLNRSNQQRSADHLQKVSDQHVVLGGQDSSDQQVMTQPVIIQRSPVIASVGSHISLLMMADYAEPQTSSVDLSNQ